MKKNVKHLLAVCLLLVAGTIFTYSALAAGDIPYVIMGVGIIISAVVIAIVGRNDREE